MVQEEALGAAFVEIGGCLLEEGIDGEFEFKLFQLEGGKRGRQGRFVGTGLGRLESVWRVGTMWDRGSPYLSAGFPGPFFVFVLAVLAIGIGFAGFSVAAVSQTTKQLPGFRRDTVHSTGINLDAAI